jgi:hypothetical protein
MTDARRALQRILADKPKLHFWPMFGGWNYGGFDDEQLTFILDTVMAHAAGGEHRTLETGAGLSTLVFLAASPARHTCIAPDGELKQRILEQVARFDLDPSRLQFVVARSDIALPVLTDVEPFADVALIDGCHGFTSVFVDFNYIHRVLKPGAALFVDDTQIYSVQQLIGLLSEQPGWESKGAVGKLALFEKQSDERFLPEHGGQPFVLRQSK